ncbi:hypothetical protein ONE63_002109 [Megalurothrips usitatus]|uniref:Serine/arginine repetitive matrix protein 2-like n=1 Tax=Megalurothrips usitatus TaxID=439358 RepID=A0AAV7XCN1_9NEOP|nr:hypothetical protein ONE63_002109 [Megalurothrips usitatus]
MVTRIEPDVISSTVVVQEKSELLESNTPSLSPLENSGIKANLESVAEAPRNEKELSLEDTCSNELKQISPAKQNKININLKTQILAPTSVLRPESVSKVSASVEKRTYSRSSRPCNKKLESSSSDPSKMKADTSNPDCDDKLSTLKEPCSPLSSVSNDSLSEGVTIRRKKDKKGRKRESSVSSLSVSSDDLRSKHKRSRKKKKDSPVERRKREKGRKLKDLRKRSPSRSRSPHKTSRRRDRSPKSYRKRRRTYSRSPSPLCNRRFSRKRSRSPRRRSRSKSPVYSRTRKAQSPTDHRRRKSRSKSPFINEICRLKKQWEKEDEAKKGRYGQVQPKGFLSHIPSWAQEANSTTIVSNMAAISVSVESVQVHSASFSFGNAVDVCPPAFPIGLSPGCAPLSLGAHFGLPDYSIHPNENLYPMTVPATPVLTPGSVVDPPSTHDQGTCEVQPHPQICASQPQTVLALPPIPGIVSSSETTSTNPPTSMLRKQLDILMSSVAPTLSDPVTSLGNNSTVQITHQPKEESISVPEKQSSEETGNNIVPPPSPPLEHGAGKECTRSVENEHKVPLGSEKNTENEKPRNTLNSAGNLSSDKDSLGIHEVEEYDSDVIIEDPPPKAPVELVCLSADEMDNKCPLYDLDKELNKIDEDAKELNQLEKGGEATTEHTEKLLRRKRKRKKKSKSKESSREKAKNAEMKCNESPVVDLVEDSTEISDDNSDSMILRECREMIDSLRIGRFVFINDDDNDDKTIDEAAAAGPEDSNSVLYSSGVQFSYTKRPPPNQEPRTKNISTNTPIRLLIDVCCGNEDNVAQNDFGVQVTSKCHGCIEKKDVIRELNTQLLALKKERDHLLSLVCNIGSSSQIIPGLDIPLEPQTDAAKDLQL